MAERDEQETTGAKEPERAPAPPAAGSGNALRMGVLLVTAVVAVIVFVKFDSILNGIAGQGSGRVTPGRNSGFVLKSQLGPGKLPTPNPSKPTATPRPTRTPVDVDTPDGCAILAQAAQGSDAMASMQSYYKVDRRSSGEMNQYYVYLDLDRMFGNTMKSKNGGKSSVYKSQLCSRSKYTESSKEDCEIFWDGVSGSTNQKGHVFDTNDFWYFGWAFEHSINWIWSGILGLLSYDLRDVYIKFGSVDLGFSMGSAMNMDIAFNNNGSTSNASSIIDQCMYWCKDESIDAVCTDEFEGMDSKTSELGACLNFEGIQPHAYLMDYSDLKYSRHVNVSSSKTYEYDLCAEQDCSQIPGVSSIVLTVPNVSFDGSGKFNYSSRKFSNDPDAVMEDSMEESFVKMFQEDMPYQLDCAFDCGVYTSAELDSDNDGKSDMEECASYCIQDTSKKGYQDRKDYTPESGIISNLSKLVAAILVAEGAGGLENEDGDESVSSTAALKSTTYGSSTKTDVCGNKITVSGLKMLFESEVGCDLTTMDFPPDVTLPAQQVVQQTSLSPALVSNPVSVKLVDPDDGVAEYEWAVTDVNGKVVSSGKETFPDSSKEKCASHTIAAQFVGDGTSNTLTFKANDAISTSLEKEAQEAAANHPLLPKQWDTVVTMPMRATLMSCGTHLDGDAWTTGNCNYSPYNGCQLCECNNGKTTCEPLEDFESIDNAVKDDPYAWDADY
ncbi:MAG: hypothetical protein HYV63_27760 [Candidatus Schekmanbacteria bacterium]|nr:hypothetical protein [Candidatus Schekmanbacteria bacterium]